MARPLDIQTIKIAHSLIANPEAWTWATLARDAAGEACAPWDRRAKRFCAVGVLLAVAYRLTGHRDEAVRIAGIAADVLTRHYAKVAGDGIRALIDINDAHGREVVLSLFERVGRDECSAGARR